MASYAVQYFGEDTVTSAVGCYFLRHGMTEKVRDQLLAMEIENGDEFFQMVADYVEENFSTVQNKD